MFVVDSRDIFYLTLDEILSDKSPLQTSDLTSIVDRRKAEYAQYKSLDLPTHFVSLNGSGPSIKSDKKWESKSSFSGQGCSAGKISGKVKVFKEFLMPDKVDFVILII